VKAGLVIVEKPAHGKRQTYGIKKPPTVRNPDTIGSGKCPENGQNCPDSVPQLSQNPDTINKRSKRRKCAAAPPATVDTVQTGETSALITAWASAYKARLGTSLPDGERKRAIGSLQALAKSFPHARIITAIGLWWAGHRPDFGVGIFKAKLEGGCAELLGRLAAEVASDDALALANGRTLAARAAGGAP
jgi:hypothetical protein